VDVGGTIFRIGEQISKKLTPALYTMLYRRPKKGSHVEYFAEQDFNNRTVY